MARRKTTTKSNTAAAPKTRRRKAASASRTRRGTGGFVNVFVPLFFIVSILFCLGFLGFMGYRTVTASAFFDVKAIEVRGANRVSRAEIEKIVRAGTEISGVWNADLNEIRQNIERLNFVKTATVSRVLPNGLRVNVIEREPRAVVQIDGGDFWADEEAVVLSAVSVGSERPPFTLRGWDREKSERARKDNRERVKIYLKMLSEWQEFDLARRVTAVDLADLREPKAIVLVSGKNVPVTLNTDNLNERLQKSLKAIAGNADSVEAVNALGQNVIITRR